VNAQHFELSATVRPASTAGNAVPTIQIRLNRAAISRRHGADAHADRDHLDPQFVPENAGIAEERLLAAEGMKVGSANPQMCHF